MVVSVGHLMRQGHLFAGRDTLGIPFDCLPQWAVLGPGAGLENLLFDSLQVFDNVSRQPIFGSYDDLNDLVEVNGLQLEGLKHPWKGPLRVVRKNDDFQAASEHGLENKVLRQEVVKRLALGLLRD